MTKAEASWNLVRNGQMFLLSGLVVFGCFAVVWPVTHSLWSGLLLGWVAFCAWASRQCFRELEKIDLHQ